MALSADSASGSHCLWTVAPGNEVIVFHVLDNDEINFPFEALTEEKGQPPCHNPPGLWPFFPAAIREDCGTAARSEYLREFDQFFGAYRKGCADLGVDYKVMNTNSSLELALSRVPVPAQPGVRSRKVSRSPTNPRLQPGGEEG